MYQQSTEYYQANSFNWRPVDSLRLRLPNLVRPSNNSSVSDNEIHSFSQNYDLLFNYSFIRSVKPNIMVETGVQNGFTTEQHLGAMAANNKGRLISFDIGDDLINGDESTCKTWDGKPGQYIRDELKDRWSLVLGNSTARMPLVLLSLDEEIDIFFHDSYHAPEYIDKELNIIYPFMKKGGYIFMHDHQNLVFGLESRGHMVPVLQIPGNPNKVWQIV